MKILSNFFIFIITFQIVYSNAFGQASKESFYPFTVEIKKQYSKNAVSAARYFKFIDERDDTTRMGYFYSDNKIFYFSFAEPAANYLTAKYNKPDKVSVQDTVYVGIKLLWISQEKISASLAKSILLTPVTTVGSCRIICNMYKKIGGSFIVVEKYDSAISKKGYLGNTNDELLGKALYTMMQRADKLDSVYNYKKSKGIQFNERSAKSLPDIVSNTIMREGIYLSYAGFLNNKPFEIPFEFADFKKSNDIKLLEKTNDDSLYVNKSWGFCKNGIAYVRLGDSFAQLIRYQNSFDLFVASTVNVKYNQLSNAFWTGFSIANILSGPVPESAVLEVSLKKTTNKILWVGIYKLDIESGQIY